jgi:hypothetical protein
VTTLTLAERIVALDDVLAPIAHAFGGAIALAYHAEPRATIDIDLNLFVGVDRYDEVAALVTPLGVDAGAPSIADVARSDGQVRVMWDATPVDLFFAYDPFHDAAAAARVEVPFAATTIPILSASHLVVCKVVFDRAKDWVDIDSMVAADAAIDVAEVVRWVGRISGDTDPRYERILAILSRR